MSESVSQTEQRTCRFPGCEQQAMPSEPGIGRPREYCDDPAHTRAAAWRARQRPGQSGEAREADARPVDAARQRASELRGQVGGMIEHLEQQLHALVGELRTVGDLDAAEAQLESVASDAAEQVAAANARASRAEQAQRRAEAERAEADAAASEATERSEELAAVVEDTRAQLQEANQNLDQVVNELAETVAAAEAERQQTQLTIVQLRDEAIATQALLKDAEQERDDVSARLEVAIASRAEAEERARTAGERTTAEAARAVRAETETVAVREQVEAARGQIDQIRDQVADLRGSLAGMTAERDAARADIERERVHGDQRVADLRTTYERQQSQLQDQLAQAREETREGKTDEGRSTRSSSPNDRRKTKEV